jgi:hypothetical protein
MMHGDGYEVQREGLQRHLAFRNSASLVGCDPDLFKVDDEEIPARGTRPGDGQLGGLDLFAFDAVFK